ncbi:MAG: hypothetical protein K6D90_06940 [Lachnospiraceae bacterium]|nr:hypothetical protein [Lachnospiraceae bacterium]
MKYYFKQEITLLFEKGVLYNENEEEVYTFEGKTFLLPELYLYKNSEFIGRIVTKPAFFIQKYEIYLRDELIDTVTEVPTFFNTKLEMENIGLRVKGNFLQFDYDILGGNDRVLAHVQEELLHLTRHYSIEIFDEEQEELLILIILAIFRFANDSDDTHVSSSSGN